MAFNPAKQGEALNSPVERASKLNDPQFENQQGYFPYDLTHAELITPRYGEITPSMHLDTVPGDRTVVHDNTKLILNQINGNLLSTVNQYVDSFYVPLRSVYPMNYEKLIPNPVKGQDLPNSALPQVPLYHYFYHLIHGYDDMGGLALDGMDTTVETMDYYYELFANDSTMTASEFSYYVGRVTLLATILSRGQLLDYLGLQFDDSVLNATQSSNLQSAIDKYFSELWNFVSSGNIGAIWSYPVSLNSNVVDGRVTGKSHDVSTLSMFRNALSDIFEAGRFPVILEGSGEVEYPTSFSEALIEFADMVAVLFGAFVVGNYDITHLDDVDAQEDPFNVGTLNIGKILAYQQVVAQYYTNDRVDNVYSSELFMQNLRSVMFPSVDGRTTTEPTFEMNGVSYEYDYISYGAFFVSLISDLMNEGKLNRQWLFGTLMLLLRRSLRYGDMFTTSRVNMLAVNDQLGINVDGGQVSPIDVTRNLLIQRYLNAVNYIGQGYLQYMSSIYGIKPSDTGTIPRFISHRKIVLQNQITNNTADDQGAQTTNLVGYSDTLGFDVFIDDFGYLISLTSFDVLPIYKSGIDSAYHLDDRYSYFNPMMQGIGDQPVRSSELLGFPNLRNDVFGYQMRDYTYKWKLSKAHGAFCNSLPGFLISHPINVFNESSDEYDITINPDYIREKPAVLDSVVPQMTGISPAEYFHFIVACTNQVHCARKIQATPGVLF